MDIHEVVRLAKRVHDAEGYNLGTGSTREYRNAFWARAIGIVHHGHPSYNPTPDPQWHIKDAGGGRPQSDDVAVSMPSRRHWDCIPNAGRDDYRFEANGGEVLGPEQNVFAPPVPSGAAPNPRPTPQPTPTPTPPPVPLCSAPDVKAEVADLRTALIAFINQVSQWRNDSLQHHQQLALISTRLAELDLQVKDLRATLSNGLAFTGEINARGPFGSNVRGPVTGVVRG